MARSKEKGRFSALGADADRSGSLRSTSQGALRNHFVIACLVALPVQLAAAGFTQRNLVSDGFIPAEHTDANLINSWGIVPNPAPNGFWWVSNAETGTSTLYDGEGNINPLIVTIPPPPRSKEPGRPTGIVFSGGNDFIVTDGVNSGAARFMFAGEDGIISGWAPGVPPPPPSTQAMIAIDDSAKGGVYKGLALATVRGGHRLFTTDFHSGSVDAFDGGFRELKLEGGFADPDMPAGFAPFGIRAVGDRVYVTYALQDKTAHDDVPGPGNGYVNVFDTDGVLIQRLVSQGVLNSPWGIAIAPPNFGHFSGSLLIGNFGDGWINAFDPASGEFRGSLEYAKAGPIAIDGLWGIDFGNGHTAGPNNTLFFAAGPEDEEHGLFGRLDQPLSELSDLDQSGSVDGADLAIVLDEWGNTVSVADINGDGTVDATDLALLLGSWSSTP